MTILIFSEILNKLADSKGALFREERIIITVFRIVHIMMVLHKKVFIHTYIFDHLRIILTVFRIVHIMIVLHKKVCCHQIGVIFYCLQN